MRLCVEGGAERVKGGCSPKLKPLFFQENKDPKIVWRLWVGGGKEGERDREAREDRRRRRSGERRGGSLCVWVGKGQGGRRGLGEGRRRTGR